MKYILFFLFSFFAVTSFFPALGQAPVIEWQKCLGGGWGDYAHDIQPTSDGGFIVVGYSGSNEGDVTGNHGTNDIWVAKLSPTGNLQWQKALGGRAVDEATAVHQTADGGYLIGGYSSSSDGDLTHNNGGMDYWLVKLSATGNLLWQKAVGGNKNDYCYSMEPTPDGGYILAGQSESTAGDVSGNHGGRDYWVVKLNSAGNIQWQKSLGGSRDDEAFSVKVTSDGGYMVAGWTESNDGDVSANHGGRDYWVVKLNVSGVVQWQKTLGGSRSDILWDMQATADGGCVLAGYSSSNDGDVSGNHQSLGSFADFWVVKLNATGQLQWQKCLGGNFNEMAYSISLSTDGGYIVAGSSESANGDLTCNAGFSDYWVVKLNNAGGLVWQKSMGASNVEEAYAVRPVADGGVIVTGFTGSSSISGYHPNLGDMAGDYWVIKLSGTITTGPNPSISISTPSTDICSGSPFVFTAMAVNAGVTPVYQWQLNGINVGSNSSIFTTTQINSGDVIRCILTPAAECNGVSAPVVSNSITMLRSGVDITPEVTISASEVSVCSGTSVIFTAVNKSGNPNPSYQWSVNGAPVGTNSPTFTSNTLPDGAVVMCRMTVPQCAGGSTKDDSDPIKITVKPVLKPAVLISSSSLSVCEGVVAAFTAKAIDGGDKPVYQWNINGQVVGTNEDKFATSTLKDGDKVSCILQPDLSTACAATPSVLSNVLTIKVTEAKPITIRIDASETTLCSGSAVRLEATVENAGATPSYQWEINGIKAGGNSPVFTTTGLQNGDKVVCVLNAQNTGCVLTSTTTSNTIVFTVKPTPVVDIKPTSATIMAGAQLQLEATVSGSLQSYTWEPASYLISPQNLSTTTIPLQQDIIYQFHAVGVNGCRVDRRIEVKVMKKLFMPDSFTPNGDGVNDVFRIPNGANIQLKEFSVFDRWGHKVFVTRDIKKGWDGKNKGGVPLATGIYVYVLNGTDDKGEVFKKGTFLLVR